MAKPAFISEEEASVLIGLPAPTLRRYVVTPDQKLPISWTRATKKAKPLYNRVDIEQLQLQNMRTAI
jgi:hypothetical protein